MIKRILTIVFVLGLLIPSASEAAAAYQLTTGTGIIRVSDGAVIPADPNNADYQKYQAWIVAGNTPDPVMSLAQAQAAQLATINQAAQATYTAGFQSSATGSPLWYDSDLDSQRVIDRQYLIALTAPATYNAFAFPGAPAGTTPVKAKASQAAADSTKTIQCLTAAQMITLGQDMAAAWVTTKNRLWARQQAIYAATTVSAVQAVVW